MKKFARTSETRTREWNLDRRYVLRINSGLFKKFKEISEKFGRE